MKKAKRVLSILVIMSLLVSAFAACGNAKTGNITSTIANSTEKAASGETGQKKLDPVKLTIFTGGDQPDQPGFAAVADAVAKATADTINVQIDVQTYPWGDYKTKVDTSLAAGQDIDIYLDFNGEMQKDANKKQIIPLDELVDQYGADLKKMIPADIWNDVKYQGKTYAVPAVYPFVGQDCIIIRGDLREKYGIPKINDITTFEQYLDAVVKNEKGMVGYDGREGRGACISDGNLLVKGQQQTMFSLLNNDWTSIIVTDTNSKPYKVTSFFESDRAKENIKWTRKAYANGWMAKDILTQKDPQTLFASGKSAAYGIDMWTVSSLAPTMEANIPGCKIETVSLFDYNNVIRKDRDNNFAVISSACKNPERAMMFLNWIRASQDNYNLMMYGIKGKDWLPVDDKTYELGPNVNPAKMDYNPTPWWFKNQNMDLTLKGSHSAFLNIYNQVINAKYTTPEVLDFSFDSSPVKAEVAQLQTAVIENWLPVYAGIKNTDSDYKAAIDALYKAGLQKVIDEAQKQIDTWYASK